MRSGWCVDFFVEDVSCMSFYRVFYVYLFMIS